MINLTKASDPILTVKKSDKDKIYENLKISHDIQKELNESLSQKIKRLETSLDYKYSRDGQDELQFLRDQNKILKDEIINFNPNSVFSTKVKPCYTVESSDSLVLKQTESLTMYKENNPMSMSTISHIVLKSGGVVYRYSTENLNKIDGIIDTKTKVDILKKMCDCLIEEVLNNNAL